MSLTFNGVPKEIQEKMLERQAEQNDGVRNPDIFDRNICAGMVKLGFDWTDTAEGNEFWRNILIDKDFESFYALYPLDEKDKEHQEMLENQVFTDGYLLKLFGKYYAGKKHFVEGSEDETILLECLIKKSWGINIKDVKEHHDLAYLLKFLGFSGVECLHVLRHLSTKAMY